MIPEDLKGKKGKRTGRPANNSVLLSAEEFTWLQRSLAKRASLAKAGSGNTKKVRDAVIALDEKLAEVPAVGGKIPLKLQRVELAVLYDIVRNQLLALDSTILPSYESRGLTANPRYAEASESAKLLRGLKEMMESVLDKKEKKARADARAKNTGR